MLGYLFNLRFGEMIFQTVGLLFVVTCWALLSFVNVCSFPSSDLVGTWPIVFVAPTFCRLMVATFRAASAVEKGQAAFPARTFHVHRPSLFCLCGCSLICFGTGFLSAVIYLLWFESGDEL